MTMFVDNANLLKKIVFPVAVLPLIVMGTAMVNALILLLAILLIFFALGHFPGIMIVWLIPLFGVTLVFALGLGGILGIMNVFVRDISQIVPLFLQALFWFTPIVYMPTIIPEAYRHYFIYNPIVPIVEGFQNVLVFNKSPELLSLMWIALIGAALVLAATALYKKAAPEMVDVL
jgi:lipopolysaccharide transport system permease protein